MTGNTDGLSATPSNWPNNPNRPVDMVSWNDIEVFLSRLNQQQAQHLPSGWTYGLPTEAQWEYAVVLAQPLPIFGMELILPVLIIIGMVPTIQEVIFVKLEMWAVQC